MKISLPKLIDVALLFLAAVVLNIDTLSSRGELITHDWSFLRFSLLGNMMLKIGTLDARRAKKMEMEEGISWLV